MASLSPRVSYFRESGAHQATRIGVGSRSAAGLQFDLSWDASSLELVEVIAPN